MQKNFEKNIETMLKDFSIQPSEQVWIDVEKTLHPKRKRRFAAWWLLPSSIAIIAITFVLLNQYRGTQKNISIPSTNISDNKKTSENKIQQNIQTNKLASNHSTSQTIFKKTTPTKSIQKSLPPKKVTINKNNKLQSYITEQTISNELNKLNKSVEKFETIGKSIATNNTATNITGVLKDTTSLNEKKHNSAKKISSSIDSSLTKENLFKEKKISPLKNWKKYFSFAAGSFSAINSLDLFNTQKSFDAYNSSLSITGSTSQSTYFTATEGFTVQAGLLLQKNLSSKFLFNTGLSINYYTNKQKVGNIKDSLADRANVSYKPGFTNSQTNNLFALQIPTTFLCYVKPKGNTKFFVSSGLQTNIVLYKKWLVADKVLDGFYYHKSALPNIQFNAMFGIGASFKNTLQLSINYSHSINRFYSINTESKYAQQLYFQFSYPIFSKNK